MTVHLRVLLAEDSEDDALLLEHELRNGGFEPIIERVETPEAMTARLDAGDWDVVLADYSMPRFNALAALAMVQDRGIDLPFIIVSGNIGEETAVAAMKAGAHDYLMKDNLAHLVPAVHREFREADERRARREAEEGLEAAREKAAAQDRLAAVGRLAAGISHDFNSILGSITLHSELLLLHSQLAGENRNRLELMRDQAMRGASLVSQIQDFSRRSIIERHPLDLEPHMRETEKLLVRTLPEDIHLEIRFGGATGSL
ncbi:MAG: response regulator [Anaerolineales bacterium]